MSRGTETRERILERAVAVATRDGLEGVTIGRLADDLRLSKSGLFRHFGSKEDLQLAVLRTASERFTEAVFRPALKAPRGLPRLEALVARWLEWVRGGAGTADGCLFVAAASELDDRPGPVRDLLVETQRAWLGGIARAARLAIEEGHLRPGLDPEQFAFEFEAIGLGFHHAKRLLRDPRAEEHARRAFDRLLAAARV